MNKQKFDATSKDSDHELVLGLSDLIMMTSLQALNAVANSKGNVVIFSNSNEQLDQLHAALRSLKPNDVSLHIWSSWEHSPFSSITSSIQQKLDRLKTLQAILQPNQSNIILCTPESWIQPTAPASIWSQWVLHLKKDGDLQSIDDFREKLISMGYVKSELVEEAGQFSIRGEIIDLFIPTSANPIRIELFDTVIEQIRYFHPETQRTLRTDDGSSPDISEVSVSPAEEVVFPWNERTLILERIKSDCDSRSVSRKIRDPVFEAIRSGYLPENFRTWIPFVYEKCGFLHHHLETSGNKLAAITLNRDLFALQIKQELQQLKDKEQKSESSHRITPSYESLYSIDPESFDRFIENHQIALAKPFLEKINLEKATASQLNSWIEEGFDIRIGVAGISTREHIKYQLKEFGFPHPPTFLDYDPENSYLIFDMNGSKIAFLSSTLFLGKSRKKSEYSRKTSNLKFSENSEAISAVQELNPGDHVVHTLHGIGKFIGLETLRTGESSSGEYLLIEYLGKDRLYLPVYRLNAIQRYVGSGATPVIDKLGTGNFEKAKQKARESARKLAINLVELYAKRSLLKGSKFSVPDEEYFSFCDEFEFEETQGQLDAIQNTLQDLQSGKLLDRLICGDVGFGKTEVAIRAAFQAIQSGFQVAVLVPTTLLAFQHEQSFKKRMKNFPIRIESLSRFKSKKTQTELVQELTQGKIDIIIGTHRILSKDISFNKLGLLIVDEEHRFGVEHKEKIKAIQANTHTLTLTATPIPRTLNMALSGLKEMSLIRTPPHNRQSIKTFIAEHSPSLIKTAIENELARGGQVFFLSNRVQGMEHLVREIQKLVPYAKVSFAHGQMSESEIESRMMDFYQGYSQILVCTTIIESGIDVPNAGTILIDRADRLGLAQLYQIRGRVGRSHRKSFAYLLVNEEKVLSNEAKMRLDVLQRFVELGSGFHIASHDLEIRGGGNLLGAEQSGNIASVGLDLFIELLEEAVQSLKGSQINIEDRHFEPEIQVPVNCEISRSYIEDPRTRLSLYRKISLSKNDTQLESIETELVDRFGALPSETVNLLWIIRIKNLLKKVGIENLSVQNTKTSLTVKKQSHIDTDEVMKLYVGPKTWRDPRLSVTPDSKIVLNLAFTTLQDHYFELMALFSKIAPKLFENAKGID